MTKRRESIRYVYLIKFHSNNISQMKWNIVCKKKREKINVCTHIALIFLFFFLTQFTYLTKYFFFSSFLSSSFRIYKYNTFIRIFFIIDLKSVVRKQCIEEWYAINSFNTSMNKTTISSYDDADIRNIADANIPSKKKEKKICNIFCPIKYVYAFLIFSSYFFFQSKQKIKEQNQT